MEPVAVSKMVEKIELENGLMLELYDASKPMAGDRWLVSFIAAIDVDVRAAGLSGYGIEGVTLDDLVSVLGEKTQFRYEKKSYFVDMRQKDAVFDKLKKDFLNTNIGYFSKPGFAGSLVARNYKVAKKGMVIPIGIH